MGHLPPEMEERLHGVAGHLELAPPGSGLVEGALGHRVADGAGLFDDHDLVVGLHPPCLLHHGVAVHQLEVGVVVPHGLDEGEVGLVHAEPPRGEPSLLEDAAEDLLDEPVDQFALLHDGDGVHLADPRHPEAGLVHLAARAEEDRFLAGEEQGAVERGGLTCDELGTQRCQVADVLVLPDEETIHPRGSQRFLGPLHPVAPQPRDIESVLPVDPERPTGITAHSNLRFGPNSDRESSDRGQTWEATKALDQVR